jgi:LmbE family N-acetylglucosaminyl deacetylase
MSKIVCVFAHPDDESFGPGGTIAKYSQEHEVYILCCTDGDHQEKGLKDVRSKELLASSQILGVKQVFFLGFTDGELSNNKYSELASKIQAILDEIQPETVITFNSNGVSGHIDHMAVTSVVNYLFNKLNYLHKIMFFSMKDVEREQISDYFVYMPPGISRQEADEIIDTSTSWDTKVQAMDAHVSQKSDRDWLLSILEGLPKEEWFKVRQK